MKTFKGKPIVKVDWGYKSNGDFETFPETYFCSVADSNTDSDEDSITEVSLVALVKSDNMVFGISSEGDTYQNIYAEINWHAKLVCEFLTEYDHELNEGFKYHFGDSAVLNPNGVIVAGVEGIRSSDGTYIKYENVSDYMIKELIPQWRLLQPGVEWDIFKLNDYLEDTCLGSGEYFELEEFKSRYRIKNPYGFIIAEQGNQNPSDDFVGLIQDDGTFDNSPWKDLTEEKIKAHLDIWKTFGKDMTLAEIKITRDDDPIPEVEDDVKVEASNSDNSAWIASWFVCYDVARYYDHGTTFEYSHEDHDGIWGFNPDLGLDNLKKRIADYHNELDQGHKQKEPLTEKSITIKCLTKLN